jgi:TRAP-type mannitol/chloroaromatic compound transport system permease large subunit
MTYYIVKIAVTVALIVAISEISKRSPFVAGVLASIPLVSVLAMIWLYVETRDAARVAALAETILWLVPPSLVLFLVLPVMLHRGYNFYLSLLVAAAGTVITYYATISIMRRVT